MKIFLILIVLLIVGLGIRLFMLGKKSQSMAAIDSRQSPTQFQQCSTKPNCVCSQYPEDKEHFIEPIHIGETIEQIAKKLKAFALKNGWVLVKNENNYFHFEVKSGIFGFIDDVEILISENQIHLRSASRVGHSDLGANRKRLKYLISNFK